ncbi:hypothetical protein PGQ11_006029 [Apiospora arundinis]|uniref:Uncharacterized protein n=1 Tax=Apiospora arundinis TaxID=335852 RepID=A0ABR2ISB2_9PEZI
MSHPGQSQHGGAGGSVHPNSQLILHPSQAGPHHSHPQAIPQASTHSTHPSRGNPGAPSHPPTALPPSANAAATGSRRVRFSSPNISSSLYPEPSSSPNLGVPPAGYNYGVNSPPAQPPSQPPILPPVQQPPGGYPLYPSQPYTWGYYRPAAAAPQTPPAPARWQNSSVEVVLPNNVLFHCYRDDILFHFPAMRQDPFGRRLYPTTYLARQNNTLVAHEGLENIFRLFEQWRLRGTPVRLFDRAADLLDRSNNARQAYCEACRAFIGACAALDKEWGLGCSDDLLRQVDEFVLILMQGYDPAYNSPAVLVGLINAYSQVFQPSTPRHVQTVRSVWRALPLYARSAVAASLWGRTAAAPKTSSRSAFMRILRDMSLF